MVFHKSKVLNLATFTPNLCHKSVIKIPWPAPLFEKWEPIYEPKPVYFVLYVVLEFAKVTKYSMYYIKNTENSAWEYFQTPRREFKIRRAAEYSDEL